MRHKPLLLISHPLCDILLQLPEWTAVVEGMATGDAGKFYSEGVTLKLNPEQKVGISRSKGRGRTFQAGEPHEQRPQGGKELSLFEGLKWHRGQR